MQHTQQTGDRLRVSVTCTRCKKQATVPFQPTAGRPVYCRECYAKPQRAPVGRARYAPNATPPKRMLAMKRKGHFVYDAMRAFGDEAEIDDEEQKRTFIEMVFARGSRQSTEDALDFIQEKQSEDMISSDEAQTLSRLVERYSMKR